MVKNPPANAGDMGSISGSGRSPEEGNGNPLQYSCLENPMTAEPSRLQSMGVTKSQTRLSDFHFYVNAAFFCLFKMLLSILLKRKNKSRLAI